MKIKAEITPAAQAALEFHGGFVGWTRRGEPTVIFPPTATVFAYGDIAREAIALAGEIFQVVGGSPECLPCVVLVADPVVSGMPGLHLADSPWAEWRKITTFPHVGRWHAVPGLGITRRWCSCPYPEHPQESARVRAHEAWLAGAPSGIPYMAEASR
jgi:hypothetical protein